MDVQTLPSKGNFDVVTKDSPHFERVVELFKEVIAPLYGDQAVALDRIAKAADRTCEVLVIEGVAKAILVYKNEPVQEFECAPNAPEIKTLFVIPGARGAGLGKQVMERVKQVANQAKFESVAVTVSENVPISLNYFERSGFERKVSWEGKYITGVTEHLMVLSR